MILPNPYKSNYLIVNNNLSQFTTMNSPWWDFQSIIEQMKQLHGPRNQDQRLQKEHDDRNQRFNRWTQPEANSKKPFAVERQTLEPEKMMHPTMGLINSYNLVTKKVERQTKRSFIVKYYSGINSEDWMYCPHCHCRLKGTIDLYCHECGKITSFMMEITETGTMKRAPHVIGCRSCPMRKNNILLSLNLNEDQLCVNCFDKLN